MRQNFRSLFALLAHLLSASALAAETQGTVPSPVLMPSPPATAPLGLTSEPARYVGDRNAPRLQLEQALELAYRKNLSVTAAQQDVESKSAAESSEFRQLLPKISATSTRTDMVINNAADGSEAETYRSSIKLSQTLYKGLAMTNEWKKAELSTEQSRLSLYRAAQTVTYDIKSTWYEILKNAYLYEEAKGSLERLKIHAKNAQAFFLEGKYWRNDVLQANVKVAQGEQKLIEAENDLSLAKAKMNRFLRRSLDEAFEADGELTFTPMKVKLEEAFAAAIANRPDLRKSQLSVDKAKIDEQTQKSAYQPTVDFSTEQAWDAGDASYRKSDNSTKVLLTVSWNAFEWGRTVKDVQSARATTEKSAMEMEEAQDKIRLEVKEAFLNAQEAIKKLEVLKQSLDQSEENYRVNQIRYREQLGTATELLNALDLLTTTRTSYITALSAYLTALASMDKAIGILPESAMALIVTEQKNTSLLP